MKLQLHTQQRLATIATIIFSLAIIKTLYNAHLFPGHAVFSPLVGALAPGVALVLTFQIPSFREADYKVVARGVWGAYIAIEVLGAIMIFLVARSYIILFGILGCVAFSIVQAIGLAIAVYAIRRIQRRGAPHS